MDSRDCCRDHCDLGRGLRVGRLVHSRHRRRAPHGRVAALDLLRLTRRIEVRAGETVRFVVTNEGVLEHEFAIGGRAELQNMP